MYVIISKFLINIFAFIIIFFSYQLKIINFIIFFSYWFISLFVIIILFFEYFCHYLDNNFIIK